MFCYLILIWWLDKYDREPFGLILLNFFWGAFGAIFLGIIGSSVIHGILSLSVSEYTLQLIGSIAIAPIVEEITKGIFLLLIVSFRSFDNMTDGAVYGGAIGLGFGMTENFLYFVSYGDTVESWILIVIIRTLFSAVMHCMSTAIFGASLGYSKFKSNKIKFTVPLLGLFLAIFMHSIWNMLVSFEESYFFGFLFIIVSVIIIGLIFQLSLTYESKIIRNELNEEIKTGLIPTFHLEILPSTYRRNRKGWIDEKIRKEYIQLVTKLTFRKMQFKQLHSEWLKEDFKNEINSLRSKISNLLALSNNKIMV
ncbi:MAG: PrsW family intramembrane metalloprotease [Ignavibacteria bacterium]|nr:PrsW family intramembrane metalloprotease [Ignavibacteria bacterium]